MTDLQETDIADSRAAPILSFGQASSDDMARINKIAKRSLTADDVYVVRAIASHDGYDSHYTRMDPETTLQNFAADGASSGRGVPIMNCHSRWELPIGRSFNGSFENSPVPGVAGTKAHTTLDFYLPRGMTTSTAANDDIIRAIETGVATDCSVGFGGNYRYQCDVCGDPNMLRSAECPHWPGQYIYKDGKRTDMRATATVVNARLMETSPVWRGSTPGAAMVKRMQALVERGVLSPDEIREIDAATGQRMAQQLDWESLKKRSTHIMPTTPEERQDALEAAIEATVERTEAPVAVADPTPAPLADTVRDALLGVLEAEGIADQASLSRLVSEAEDGRAYREDLRELLHRAGIRAGGASYSREVNEKMLASLTTADMRAELELRTKLVQERFRKDVPGTGDASTETMRADLAAEHGGRQTEPAKGPLGHTPTDKMTPTSARDSGDDQFSTR